MAASPLDELIPELTNLGLDTSRREAGYGTLARILGNIRDDPTEPKYHTIKKSAKVLQNSLCDPHTGQLYSPVRGILREAGFKETVDAYVWDSPTDQQHETLIDAAERIEDLRDALAAAVNTGPTTGSGTFGRRPTAGQSRQFTPRTDVERKRLDHEKQMRQVKEASRDKFYGSASVLPSGQSAEARSTTSSESPEPSDGCLRPTSSGKSRRSAFDFESRQARVDREQRAQDQLTKLREEQRRRYQEAAADPQAFNTSAYRKPPSIAPGGREEGSSWTSWLPFFGGSSSSSSPGGGPMFRHSTTETSLRLEVIISLVDASPVGQQMAHLITTDKACELSLRLTLMEYPVLAIVPPAVDIDTTHVIDFGGRGKSCDFTIKAGSVGVEPVPLWLLLAVDRQSAKQVLRVGEEDQYLLATGCFDMRKYVEKAVLGPAEVASFDKLTVALAPTTGAQPPVEVSLYLRMSRVGSSTTASRAVEIIELRPPAIVCATANRSIQLKKANGLQSPPQ
ncbi:hypothetical protein FOL46_007030 [Perkinsus olseni]|uniref:PUB domain-containing protein n=1 Tax=Perkinsus olseni TaxID=32597 RepID=A0A7J6LGA6_PEROL|nr:hypothetical protein FOL46_007030 [Perkinsus olseni]